MLRRTPLLVLLLVLFAGPVLARAPEAPATPSELFGELYAAVQTAGVFADSKTFADAIPKRPPAAILADYRLERPKTREALAAFVRRNFDVPTGPAPAAATRAAPTLSLKAHIRALWSELARPPLTPRPYSSQLPLSRPYVVPGGRFREVYYWDSYFTMLGLVRDGRGDLAAGITDDFAEMIARYGHVPNGARTYYLSRSQPPVFYLMAELAPGDPKGRLEAMRAEHRFWMQGEGRVRPGHATRHVVRLPDGSVLNRYWDARAAPRDESYREDAALAGRTRRPAAELYRDVRSAAESGWDFSSRWFADGKSLAAIETTAVVPIDLNSLLFGLERAIARGCEERRDRACAKAFTRRSERRRAAMMTYLWDPQGRTFLDYQWRRGQRLERPSAAMLYPLFVGLASPEQADGVATAVRRDLLAPGGLRTTAVATGQQWDAPNGWAPLQWIAVSGLARYGHRDIAAEIAGRWIATVCLTYRSEGRLLEKYDVETARPGGGGEYPLQDGFGWTNGVTRMLLDEYPQAPAC